MLNLAGGSHIL